MSDFKNIAISGGVAVGSTSLLNELKKVLEPDGFTCISTGNLYRQILKEKGGNLDAKNPLAEHSKEENLALEDRVQAMLESGDKYVVEGWLAGFIARDIPHTLRVLVTLNNIDVRAERFAEREGVSLDEARAYIADRETSNFKVWKTAYGDYNFWNPEYFHVVIDTEDTSKEEARDVVLEAFG